MSNFNQKMKEWIMQYFAFSRKERMGLAVLLVLMFSIWLLPAIFGSKKGLSADILKKADDERHKIADSLKLAEKAGTINIFHLFPFDPNTLDANGWKNLGIRQKTVETIQKYIAHGGRFNKPSDLSKIYSLRPDEAERLIPYVEIREGKHIWKNNNISAVSSYPFRKINGDIYKRYQYEKAKYSANPPNNNRSPYFRRNNGHIEISPVDINTADTSLFIALPGIGSKLATRIIQFREKLGGFYSIVQVSEIYGLQDSVFQLIKPFLRLSFTGIRKLHINIAGADSLNAHPYIQFLEARAIVQYRNQHGAFKDSADLLKISILNQGWLDRIAPYLSIE
jgi:competence protein ComEA